jgi:hypothetical protein
MRFENKNVFHHFQKGSTLLQRWRCTYVVVNLEVAGLAPAFGE